jgi:hypothetical protein
VPLQIGAFGAGLLRQCDVHHQAADDQHQGYNVSDHFKGHGDLPWSRREISVAPVANSATVCAVLILLRSCGFAQTASLNDKLFDNQAHAFFN